ncbi:MAG: hypothetical protein ABJL67_14820 [Sulfitobacter sp.]
MMSIWSTFRYVPQTSPEAFAWAILSFATYLGVSEFRPILMGRLIDPLALALAVQLTLSWTKNITSDRFAHAFRRSPLFSGVAMVCACVGLSFMAFYGTAAFAAKFFIFYYLSQATFLLFFVTYDPATLLVLRQGPWGHTKTHREATAMLDAAGIVIAAATLFTVWIFADPLAFAAMMSFGVLVVRMIANWIVVLYLIDQQNRRWNEPKD